jgi:hypothetical protein
VTCKSLSPRENRALEALLNTYSAIFREQIDRIAGASNGPGIIRSLRQKVTGYDGIETIRAESIDRDGRRCRPGLYRLTELGRERVSAALKGVRYGQE